MKICFDLENTLIDDLSNCNILHDKIKAIHNVIGFNGFGSEDVIFFTWGWFNREEIDMNIIHKLMEVLRGDRFNLTFERVITKEDTIKEHIKMKKFFWAGEITPFAEESFNEQFNKESAFRNICRCGSLKGEKGVVLFDDAIDEDVTMNFDNQTIHFIKA